MDYKWLINNTKFSLIFSKSSKNLIENFLLKFYRIAFQGAGVSKEKTLAALVMSNAKVSVQFVSLDQITNNQPLR